MTLNHPSTLPQPQQAVDWRARGLCYDTADPAFFPEVGRGGSASASAAKAICYRCPVQAECLDYALDTRPQNGIWGGTTEKERRKIRRGRRQA